MQYSRIVAFLVLAILFLTGKTAAGQDYSISPLSLSWEHGDVSVKSFYVSNRDSLSMTMNSSACTHFSVTPQQGLWRVDVAPQEQNTGASDIVQYIYIYVGGLSVPETVTLTHRGFTPSVSVTPDSLLWQHSDTSAKELQVLSDVPWTSFFLQGIDFSRVSGTGSGQGTGSPEPLVVAPVSANASGTDKTAALVVYGSSGSTFSADTVFLRQKANPDLVPVYGKNYIRTTTFTSPDASASFQDITYYDGLGCPMQTLAVAGSPTGKTVATQTVYDSMFRPDSVSYLPYARTDSGDTHIPTSQALSGQAAWYSANYHDGTANAAKVFESSPYGRVLSSRREGDSWENSGNWKSADNDYSLNTAQDDVPRARWSFVAGSGSVPGAGRFSFDGSWPAGTLAKTRSTDESGSVVEVFTDPAGRTVCTRSWSGAGASGTLSETLFAYDLRDSLSLVVQPEGTAALKALPVSSRTVTLYDSTIFANNSLYREYCFGYNYDGWGDLIKEHVPGGGTVERIYDARHRLVLETDDLMPQRYILTEYDTLDRITAKRLVSSQEDASVLRQACYSSAGVPASVSSGFTDICTLYTAQYFPFGLVTDALSGFTVESGVVATSDVETANVRGMLKSETLYQNANSDGTAPDDAVTFYRTRRYYYDYRGKPVQIKETDSDGWSATYSSKYDFSGNLTAFKETHTAPSFETHYLLTENTYDSRGRLTWCNRTLDGIMQKSVIPSYDELGRLERKTFRDGADCTGDIAFTRDIHGWITRIAASNDTGNDLVFSEDLRYAEPSRSATAARFDGNISEISFSFGPGASVQASDTYAYTYDAIKRLTDAVRYSGIYTTPVNSRTERNISYDRNGNMTGLDRYGDSGLHTALSFFHTGNRLTGMQAWDGEDLPSVSACAYDSMGKLVTDTRRGLQFSYNLANLPSKVEGLAQGANAGLTLNYRYLSDGTKVSATLSDGQTTEGLRYRGSFVYLVKDGKEVLSSIPWSDGRIEYVYDFPVPVEGDGLGEEELVSDEPQLLEIVDCWHVTDHLGSTRAVVALNQGGAVLEQNGYLPFGTRFEVSAPLASDADGNRYRFAGKEEQRFGQDPVSGASRIDLGLLDFGARLYDPFSARWTTRDPLAGKYLPISPYTYCGNNPIRFTDRDGLDWKDKVVGYAIGAITDIVPGTSTLRDSYSPNSSTDYNNALNSTDKTLQALGALMVAGGGTMTAAGIALSEAGAVVTASVAGAAEGVVVAAGGAQVAETGLAAAAAGTLIVANTSKNVEQGYERGNSKASINQMEQSVKKGKAPKTIIRVDKKDGKNNQQDHVHFSDGSALNKDGTWRHDSKHNTKHQITNKEKAFLKEYGWTIPE